MLMVDRYYKTVYYRYTNMAELIKNSVSVVQMELWTARWPPSHTHSHTSRIVIHLLSSYWQCVGLSESDTSHMATAPWQPSASKQIHQLQEKERDRERLFSGIAYCHTASTISTLCIVYNVHRMQILCVHRVTRWLIVVYVPKFVNKSTLYGVSHNAMCLAMQCNVPVAQW